MSLGKFNSESFLEIYREAQKNVPLLRYGWVVISAIAILGLIAFLKVGSFKDVSLATLVLLAIALLAYVLSWAIKRDGDWLIKIPLYTLVYAIVGSIVAILVSFPLHLFEFKKFSIYENIIPVNPDKVPEDQYQIDQPIGTGGLDDAVI